MMHQRISKKIIIYLFIFVTLVTITNNKPSSNFYTIKEFNINGLNILETSKIHDDLRILKNINIFLLDKKKITKKIYSYKIIEKIKIFKNYPSTLNIEIKKTKFLAITKKNNIDYLIGANGNLIKVNDTISDLPYIFGNIDVNNFLYFKEIIDNSNFRFNDMENLYYFKSNRWDVITKGGLTLKMPSNLTVKKLNLMFKIIQENDFNDNKIIDFRQSDMMVIN
jgi:cell division protein FtsQ